ncbi:MAG: ACT domain-containing protein [Deltaproteobacteria bacterium]|jgi:hypothetical protein|nr:ACT domain-containing protein [Deltaproteobacteria bacterium]
MSHTNLALSLLSDTFAICRLGPEEDIPSWVLAGDFFSVTRTKEELSLLCLQETIPQGTRCEKGFRCFKVGGPLDFSLTGILSSLTMPLAQAGISVLAISTFDTDYLLVKEAQVDSAVQALSHAGHRFV